MSVATAIAKNHTMGGVAFGEATSVASDGQIIHDVSVPAGNAGVLTVRTSDSVGSLTMDSPSHTINTGDRLDLYWEIAGVKFRRRDILVGTVAGDVVPISLGSGDVLPVATTALVGSVPVELDVAVLGTNLAAILFFTEQNGQFTVEDAAGEIFFVARGTNQSYSWHNALPDVNPVTGDTLKAVYVSHDNPTLAKIMRAGFAYNNA